MRAIPAAFRFFPNYAAPGSDLDILLPGLPFCRVFFFAPTCLFTPDAFFPANPFQTPAHIKPEWYFLANYQMLKIFPNEFLGLLVQGAAVTFLAILPFIDRGPERHPLKRPLFVALTAAGIVLYIALIIWGHYS